MSSAKRLTGLVPYILAVLSLGYYGVLAYYGQYSYWADEVYSINLFKADIPQLIAITAGDVHPPLYYVLGKLFTSIWGYSCLSFRVFSLLFFALTILMVLSVVRQEFGNITAIITIMFISLPVTALEHVLSVRMYEMASFFVTVCFLYGYKSLKYKKNCYWCIFTLSAIVAAYTHYFALLEVAYIACGVCVVSLYKKENFKRCIIMAAVCILAYLPWLGTLLRTFSRKNGSGWLMSYPGLYECLAYIYGRADELSLIILVFLTVGTGLFIWRIISQGIRQSSLVEKNILIVVVMAVVSILGTCITGILISVISSPCIHTRSLYPLNVIGAIEAGVLFSYWIKKIKKKKVAALLTVMILLGVYAGFSEKCNHYQYILDTKKEAADTMIAVNRLKEIGASETLATNLVHLWWNGLDFYLGRGVNDCFIYTEDAIKNWEGNAIYLLMSSQFNAENTQWLQEIGWIGIEYEGEYTLAGYHYYLYHLTK